MKFICNFDGACEPINPGGNMGIGAVIRDNADQSVLYEYSDFIPKAWQNSNNVAEYTAFEKVIDWLAVRADKTHSAVIYGDSQLVVKQMNAEWKIKSGHYFDVAITCRRKLTLLRAQMIVEVVWCRREQNQIADDLSKRKMIERGIEIPIRK